MAIAPSASPRRARSPGRASSKEKGIASPLRPAKKASPKAAAPVPPLRDYGWQCFSALALVVVLGDHAAAALPAPGDAALRWLTSATRHMLYLAWPSELALDDTDPAPRFLVNEGIPMFFFLIVLELVAYRLAARSQYRLDDTLACVSLGSLQYVAHFAFALVGLPLGNVYAEACYRYVWTRYRVLDIDVKAHPLLVYVCLLLGKDFAYYVAHR